MSKRPSEYLDRGGRAIGVRPGEGRTVALVCAMFACLEAGRGFGEIGVDTLVLSRIGPSALPYLFVGLGTTALIASLAYGAALGRLPRVRLLSGVPAIAGIVLLVEVLLLASGQVGLISLTWLTAYAAGMLVLTVAWTLAGAVFDARQAKRLFPICTTAAIAGLFFGTLLAGPVARTVGTDSLVALEGIMLGAVALTLVAVSRTTTVRAPDTGDDRSVVRELRHGFDAVTRSPLMRLVALAYVLLAVLMFSVTYPFLQKVSTTFPSEADQATVLGLLTAAVTAVSFIVSIAFANRVYIRIGVTGAALLLPLAYLAGFGLWIIAFSMTTAALVRFTQQVTQRGLSNAAWSAFYNVVPTESRAQVLAFNDGVPGQIGTILSGVLLLTVGSLFSPDLIPWLGVLTAAGCCAIVIGIRRRYGQSIFDALRAGLAERILEGGSGLTALTRDPTAIDSLKEALGDPEPTVRRMAVDLLGRTSVGAAGQALRAAIATDRDPSVRASALLAIAALGGPTDALVAVRLCLTDEDARVRMAALEALAALADIETSLDQERMNALRTDPSPEVLASLAGLLFKAGQMSDAERIAETLISSTAEDRRAAGVGLIRRMPSPSLVGRAGGLLDDPSPRVRATAIDAIVGLGIENGFVPELTEALGDEAGVVRRTAAAALAGCRHPQDGIMRVLRTGSPGARQAALVALRGHGPEVRAELISWTRERLTRGAQMRRTRFALTGPRSKLAHAATLEFLVAVLAVREREVVGLALESMVILGTPGADGVIRRCLSSDDPETRAQAIEALDTIGDRGLSGALIRLLEQDPERDPTHESVLSQLADDEDRWIARLAKQVMDNEPTMPDANRTDDLATMLLLRRVPLFQGLAPEDLQPIALVATERQFAAGEALVREGDLGDELIVIVAGSVRVVRLKPDGSERFLRRYDAGDHVGELAVLRDAPRAATVVAETDVRGLVIGGAGLKAILRERPEAAMAMLSTLAERLSDQ